MERKFLNSICAFDFFSSGITGASLNADGTAPVERHFFIMRVSTGRSSSRQFLRMLVGIGSSGHDVLGENLILQTKTGKLKATPGKLIHYSYKHRRFP